VHAVPSSLALPPERVGTPLLDPGSPAQASLPIRPLPRERSLTIYSTARPEGSLAFRLSGLTLEPKLAVKTVRCSAALLGMITLASRFAVRSPKSPSGRVALEGRSSLPAPLPGWSWSGSINLLPKEPALVSHSIACRRRSVLRSPAARGRLGCVPQSYSRAQIF
jgi:hypothetical protein